MGDTKTTTTTTTKLYQHTSAEEYTAWRLKIKSKARASDDGDDVCKAMTDLSTVADTKRVKANTKLFDILVDNIGNDALLNTMATRYPDKGHEALDYIQSFWASSTNDHKAETTYDDYEELQQSKLPADTTVTQINEIFNKLSNLRAALDGTTRAITTTIHSHNMIGMIKRISTDHKQEVRATIDKAELPFPDRIADALEGVVSACCVSSAKPTAPVTNNINAMAAMQMANGPEEMAAVAVFLANMRLGKTRVDEHIKGVNQ